MYLQFRTSHRRQHPLPPKNGPQNKNHLAKPQMKKHLKKKKKQQKTRQHSSLPLHPKPTKPPKKKQSPKRRKNSSTSPKPPRRPVFRFSPPKTTDEPKAPDASVPRGSRSKASAGDASRSSWGFAVDPRGLEGWAEDGDGDGLFFAFFKGERSNYLGRSVGLKFKESCLLSIRNSRCLDFCLVSL